MASFFLFSESNIVQKSCHSNSLHGKRATPGEWTKYMVSTKVMKIIRDNEPKPLFDLLCENYFEESRKPGVGYFFDNSRTLVGRQSIHNRLIFMRSINDQWNNKLQPLSNDQLRVIGKKAFFDYYTEKVVGVTTDVVTN